MGRGRTASYTPDIVRSTVSYRNRGVPGTMRSTAGHCSAGRLSVPSTDLRWDAAEERKRRHGDGQSGAGGRSRGGGIGGGNANARNPARDVAHDACTSSLETRRASRGGASAARARRAASRWR